MKKYLLGCVGLMLAVWTNSVSAQNSFVLDEQTMNQEVKNFMKNSPEYQELIKVSMQMTDVNNDNFVSDREAAKFAEGLNYAGDFTEAQKQQRLKEIMAFFDKADVSGDKKLSEQEFYTFWADVEDWMIKDRFRQMDRNNDGVYDEKDIPTMEESMAKMEEINAKLKEAVAKWENIDADALADQMVNNMMEEQYEEDFYQMDKDKNNCVSRDEFADYSMIEEKNMDLGMSLTREDYLEIYDDINKKNPECLTKEEYKADAMAPIDDDLDMEELEQEANDVVEHSRMTEEDVQAEMEKAQAMIEELQKNSGNGVMFSDFEKMAAEAQ